MLGSTRGSGGLASVVAAAGERAAESVWVEDARSERVVARAELAAVAARWREQGVAGRRLGLAVADPVAFAVLFVSLIAAGATVVPLDADAPVEAGRALLEAAGAERVVVTAADGSPVGPGRTLRASAATYLPEDTAYLPEDAAYLPEDAAYPPDDARGRPGEPTEGGCLLFSSGSTGPRKAIRLPERQLLHVARAVARAHRLGPADRGYNPLPLFHVNAEVVGLLAALASGAALVLDRRFHRTGFWPLMAQRRVTWINAVPAIVTILSQEPPGESAPRSLRFVRSASAPLPAPVLERFEARYGVPVVESYGMTEAASQITVNPLDARRPGTVGRPMDVDLRVVDDEGADAGPGAVGRVLIRGAGVIGGYEGGAGADRFDAAGWLDTGDVGVLDEDGYLTLVGRGGDVINRSGEKVFPREVEDALRGHPAVREAVVIGRPDPVLGQVPIAYAIPTDDAPADLAAELIRRCERALPRTHRPAEVNLVTELPHGPTGKTVRRLVAQHDEALLAAGRGSAS